MTRPAREIRADLLVFGTRTLYNRKQLGNLPCIYPRDRVAERLIEDVPTLVDAMERLQRDNAKLRDALRNVWREIGMTERHLANCATWIRAAESTHGDSCAPVTQEGA